MEPGRTRLVLPGSAVHPAAVPEPDVSTEIAREQDHLEQLYGLVDAMRVETAERLAELTAPPDRDADPDDRQTELAWTARQATRLAAAGQGLCFRRLGGRGGPAPACPNRLFPR